MKCFYINLVRELRRIFLTSTFLHSEHPHSDENKVVTTTKLYSNPRCCNFSFVYMNVYHHKTWKHERNPWEHRWCIGLAPRYKYLSIQLGISAVLYTTYTIPYKHIFTYLILPFALKSNLFKIFSNKVWCKGTRSQEHVRSIWEKKSCRIHKKNYPFNYFQFLIPR